MEAALVALASPAGQALMGALVAAGMKILGGADPAQELAIAQASANAYKIATAEWDAAKAANP